MDGAAVLCCYVCVCAEMDGAAVLCCYVCVCADDGEDRSAENDTSSPVKQVRCSNLIMISNTLTRQALTQSAHIWFTSFHNRVTQKAFQPLQEKNKK